MLPFHVIKKTRTAFTLVELLAAIAIIAALVTSALYFTAGYINYAKTNADKQTLTVINDALTRYKTEGGGITGLTGGANIGRVIGQLATAVTWSGMKHQFLSAGVTYPARSLDALGSGHQYHFTRYNNYTSETPSAGTATNLYPYGLGIGYMANDGITDYSVQISTTGGASCFAVKAGSTTTVYGNGTTVTVPGANTSITFWACVGPAGADNGSNSVIHSTGGVYSIVANGVNQGGTNKLTAVNLKGLRLAVDIQVRGNLLTSLDISNMTALTTFRASTNSLTSLNISGCTLLNYLTLYTNQLTSVDCSGLSALSYFDCGSNPITNINLTGCNMLSTFNAGWVPIAVCTLPQNRTHLTSVDMSNDGNGGMATGPGTLRTIDFSGATALTSLHLVTCPFTTINITGDTALTSFTHDSAGVTIIGP